MSVFYRNERITIYSYWSEAERWNRSSVELFGFAWFALDSIQNPTYLRILSFLSFFQEAFALRLAAFQTFPESWPMSCRWFLRPALRDLAFEFVTS